MGPYACKSPYPTVARVVTLQYKLQIYLAWTHSHFLICGKEQFTLQCNSECRDLTMYRMIQQKCCLLAIPVLSCQVGLFWVSRWEFAILNTWLQASYCHSKATCACTFIMCKSCACTAFWWIQGHSHINFLHSNCNSPLGRDTLSKGQVCWTKRWRLHALDEIE